MAGPRMTRHAMAEYIAFLESLDGLGLTFEEKHRRFAERGAATEKEPSAGLATTSAGPGGAQSANTPASPKPRPQTREPAMAKQGDKPGVSDRVLRTRTAPMGKTRASQLAEERRAGDAKKTTAGAAKAKVGRRKNAAAGAREDEEGVEERVGGPTNEAAQASAAKKAPQAKKPSTAARKPAQKRPSARAHAALARKEAKAAKAAEVAAATDQRAAAQQAAREATQDAEHRGVAAREAALGRLAAQVEEKKQNDAGRKATPKKRKAAPGKQNGSKRPPRTPKKTQRESPHEDQDVSSDSDTSMGGLHSVSPVRAPAPAATVPSPSIAASSRSTRQRTVVKHVDVNIVPAGSLASDGYVPMDSDEEGKAGVDAEGDDEEKEDGDLVLDYEALFGEVDVDVSMEPEEVTQDAPTPPRIDPWNKLTREEMLTFAEYEDAMRAMRKDGWELDPTKFGDLPRYPGLYDGESGPSPAVLANAESPLGLLLFFMPKKLWQKIADESNRYYAQHLSERVERMFAKQTRAQPWSKDKIMEVEARKPKIKPHEFLLVLGLLVARMLTPHTQSFGDHWALTAVGAVPEGTFGPLMSRNRFKHLMQNIHFTNNTSPKSATDRAWKVRSVVDELQRTFKRGFLMPGKLAFDEAVIPSRSRYNLTRQYLKDKPHKWGTKLFMTCCAETAYCLRLEVYCGKSEHKDPSTGTMDPNSGAAAVVRNLEAVLPPYRDGVRHVVVTDRFYTSVRLAFRLLHRGVYLVGTIMPNRIGYPAEMMEKRRTRPASIPRGTTRVAVAKNCPQLTALVWWDNKAVQLLATGGSRTMETCERRQPGGTRVVVPCPSVVRDYQRWMGGVDIHDQLRLQRYSLQLACTFKKYYKTIFLGLVDMAVTNAYIVYREAREQAGQAKADHGEFLKKLQEQLLQVKEADFEEEMMFSPGPATPQRHSSQPVPADHPLHECPETRRVRGYDVKRQHQCKVCSILRDTKSARVETKWFCPTCSRGKKRTYLCNMVRPHEPGNSQTCHQVWHTRWLNGTKRPKPRFGRDIQVREASGTKKPKKKSRRRLLQEQDGSDEDEAGHWSDDGEDRGQAASPAAPTQSKRARPAPSCGGKRNGKQRAKPSSEPSEDEESESTEKRANALLVAQLDDELNGGSLFGNSSSDEGSSLRTLTV